MSFKLNPRTAVTFMVALSFVSTGLLASATDDPAGAGDSGSTGDPATVPITVLSDADLAAVAMPPTLSAALSEWVGDPTTLALYVYGNHPEVAQSYIDEVERQFGPLGSQFEETFPDVTASYRELAGKEPTDDSLAFFGFVAEHSQIFETWQQGLDPISLQLTHFITTNHREVDSEFEVANVSPADNDVTLVDFLVERGYHGLLEAAHRLVGGFGSLPPGECGCAINEDFFSANPSSWQVTANKVDYDGAPLPIIDKRYYAENDGAAGLHRLTRRTKARMITETAEEQEDDHYTSMDVQLYCFEGSNPNGAKCKTGGCTADLATRIIYGARASIHLSPGYNGQSRAISYNRGRLFYSANNGPEQLLMDGGYGLYGKEGYGWGSFHNWVYFRVGGSVNLLNVGAEDSETADLLLEDEFNGVMVKDTSYELKLQPRTLLYVQGVGFSENKAYAYSNTSFLMTGAVHGFTCDSHVTPPDEVLFWRYAAAPGAPYDTGYFRDQIEDFSDDYLHSMPNLPNEDRADEGTWKP